MKVHEILRENFKTKLTQDDVNRAKSNVAKIKQAEKTGDMTMAMQAGADIGQMLSDDIFPEMLRLVDYIIKEYEKLCKTHQNDPKAQEVCKMLPKLKQDHEKAKREMMQSGMANIGRRDYQGGNTQNQPKKGVDKIADVGQMKKDLASLGEDTNAGSISSVVQPMNKGQTISRNMYNADGTMKNGLEFDNLLGGKKSDKNKRKNTKKT